MRRLWMVRFRQLLIIACAVTVTVFLIAGETAGAFQPASDFISSPDTNFVSIEQDRDAGDTAMAGGDPDSLFLSERNRLLLFPGGLDKIDTKLTFSVKRERPLNRLMGYEIYRASEMQCTLKGASMGASLGLMAGAFGEMMGTWDEDTSWFIGGAMAAFGALYGGKIKADDDGWSLQIRWDEGRPDKRNDQDR
jgi:hypothetical protein